MKTLAIIITNDRTEPGVVESVLGQDDPDFSLLIHVKRGDIYMENTYMRGATNCAINRNEVRAMALASNAENFLWVDSDTVIPAHTLRSFKSRKTDIVGGWYPIINNLNRWAVGQLTPKGFENYTGVKPGVIPVDMIGLGCMLITRSVMERVPFDAGLSKTIHSVTLNKKICWGTSLVFCQEALTRGFQVVADGDVVCKHLRREK